MPPRFFRPRTLEAAAVLVSLLMMAGTLFFFHRMQQTVEKMTNVFPLDSYFYVSMADNIQKGKGPRVDWPQGPQNMYFPGFAFWWALFLPRGLHPDEAIRHYAAAQCAAVLFFILALTALGRAVWKDWPTALGFAAFGGALPIALKWAALPMTEALAGACVTAYTASAFFLLPLAEENSAGGKDSADSLSPRRRRLLIAALIFFGMWGIATRIEAVYPLGLLVLGLVWRGRLRWTGGAFVLAASVLPFLLWQLWATWTFRAANTYVEVAAQTFDPMIWYHLVLFQFTFFIRVPNVEGPIFLVNALMLPLSLFFLAVFPAALRGYLRRVSCFAAWTLLGYWLLHACWNYRTERFNIIVAAFGLLFFWEGMGRLVHLRDGWRGRRGRVAMVVFLLVFVPVFWGHAWDNALHLTLFSNSVHPPPAKNQRAILNAMEKEPALPEGGPVFLTNLSLPDSRRLPGTVWFEKPDWQTESYAPGQASGFIREKKVTHLALKPPIDDWMRTNASSLECETVYEDYAVWIGRVKNLNENP